MAPVQKSLFRGPDHSLLYNSLPTALQISSTQGTRAQFVPVRHISLSISRQLTGYHSEPETVAGGRGKGSWGVGYRAEKQRRVSLNVNHAHIVWLAVDSQSHCIVCLCSDEGGDMPSWLPPRASEASSQGTLLRALPLLQPHRFSPFTYHTGFIRVLKHMAVTYLPLSN